MNSSEYIHYPFPTPTYAHLFAASELMTRHATFFFTKNQTIAEKGSPVVLSSLCFRSPPHLIPNFPCRCQRNLWLFGSGIRTQRALLYSRNSDLRSPSASPSSKRRNCGTPERGFRPRGWLANDGPTIRLLHGSYLGFILSGTSFGLVR